MVNFQNLKTLTIWGFWCIWMSIKMNHIFHRLAQIVQDLQNDDWVFKSLKIQNIITVTINKMIFLPVIDACQVQFAPEFLDHQLRGRRD